MYVYYYKFGLACITNWGSSVIINRGKILENGASITNLNITTIQLIKNSLNFSFSLGLIDPCINLKFSK